MRFNNPAAAGKAGARTREAQRQAKPVDRIGRPEAGRVLKTIRLTDDMVLREWAGIPEFPENLSR